MRWWALLFVFVALLGPVWVHAVDKPEKDVVLQYAQLASPMPANVNVPKLLEDLHSRSGN